MRNEPWMATPSPCQTVLSTFLVQDSAAQLKLYALFKQSSVGNCDGPRPGMMEFIKRAKYDAWKELSGLSQDEAKEKYIAFVEELKAADKK